MEINQSRFAGYCFADRQFNSCKWSVFVKNPELTIQELLDENNASVIEYVRFKIGEGIEIENKDFATEVAEQLK